VRQSRFQVGVEVSLILDVRRFVKLDLFLEKMKLSDVVPYGFTAVWLNRLQAGASHDRFFLQFSGPDVRDKSESFR
jgi:hypothetical protein